MFSHLAAFFSPANVLLFHLPGKILGYRYFSLSGGKGGRYAEVATPSPTPDDVLKIRERLGCRPEDLWGVGLPMRLFSMVNLQLPLAAQDDPGQAVRYGLMRHLPFDVGRSALSWLPAVKNDKHIMVTALAAPMQELEDALGFAQGLPVAAVFPGLFALAVQHGQDGVYLAGVDGQTEAVCMLLGKPVFHHWSETSPGTADCAPGEVRNLLDNLAPGVATAFCLSPDEREMVAAELGLPEASVRSITLPEVRFPRDLVALPGGIRREAAKARRKNLRLAWMQIAALVMLLVGVAGLPAAHLVGKAARVQELERKISVIRQEGEQLMALRDQNEHVVVFLHDLQAFLQAQARMSDVLLEATRSLPPPTWLTSLQYSGRVVRIQGLADSAAAVIEALENSPRFREVRLESQVTKSGDKDTFNISATLEY